MKDFTEYEINYFFVDADEVRANLQAMGATLEYEKVFQKRYIFKIPEQVNVEELSSKLDSYPQHGSLEDFVYLLPDGDYVRIRDEGNQKITFSVKIHTSHEGRMSEQKEAELEIIQPDEVKNILIQSGFSIKNYQENYREKWHIGDECTLTIDWWPYLEPYVEIEGESEDRVMEKAHQLGFIEKEKSNIVQSTVGSVAYIYAFTYNMHEDEMLSESELTFNLSTLPKWVKEASRNY